MKKFLYFLLVASISFPLFAQSAQNDSWEITYELMKNDGWKACNKGMSLKTECQQMHSYSLGSMADSKTYCYGGSKHKTKHTKEALKEAIYEADRDLAEFLIFAYASGREDFRATRKVNEENTNGRFSYTCTDKEAGIEILFKDGNQAEGYKAVYTFLVPANGQPSEPRVISFREVIPELMAALEPNMVHFNFARTKKGEKEVQSIAYCNTQAAIAIVRDLIIRQWAADGAVQIELQGKNKR